MKLDLLSVGTNAKTVKSDKQGVYLTAILYLAPAVQVDNINLCPLSDMANCRTACLYTAGRGAFNNVQSARIRKTEFWRDDREGFIDTLRNDLNRFQAYCIKRDLIPTVRLNGTSDIPFEKHGIIEEFQDIQFYDYTKTYNRLNNPQPSNYYLLLSYSKASSVYAGHIETTSKNTGANIAVVFRSTPPDTYLNRNVINGDLDDLRFLDPPNSIVALSAKGQAKKDTSGFVVD
tara:strand:- start:110 stop:805 length:696 start_codon:yes stop_codon:yes gene_type:complete